MISKYIEQFFIHIDNQYVDVMCINMWIEGASIWGWKV